MDKTTLVDADIAAGQQLLSALERAGLPVAAAMWAKVREGGWRLYVASPDVAVHGPLTVVKLIQSVLSAADVPLRLDDIVAANTTNHFVNSVAAAVGETEARRRIVDRALGGAEIEEALIYKVKKGVQPSPRPLKAGAAALKRVRELAD